MHCTFNVKVFLLGNVLTLVIDLVC